MALDPDRQEFRQDLSNFVGSKLVGILGLLFVFDGDMNSSSIEEVYLKIDGLDSLRLFCGSDGSSICWDGQDLDAFSMDEYGEFIISDMSTSEKWQDIIYKKIEKIYLVRSQLQEFEFAIKLAFDPYGEIVIANLGDDLVIYKELPLEIIAEENAQFLDIQSIIDK
jgi:hypothetical protein